MDIYLSLVYIMDV